MTETMIRPRKPLPPRDIEDDADELLGSAIDDLPDPSEDIEDDDDGDGDGPEIDGDPGGDSVMFDPPRSPGAFVRGPAEEEPARRRGGRARATPRRSEYAERISDDFANVLAGVNYEPGTHKITVYRMEPEYDPDTGRRITGMCASYKRVVDVEEIQNTFGGGRYKLLIHGPREDTGKGNQLKAQHVIEIVGDPILPKSDMQKRRDEEKERADREALIERVMDRSDRRDEEYKKELREMNNTMLQMMEKAYARPKEDPQAAATAAMTPILALLKEDSDRRDREAAAQRERDEQRRRDEAEQRRLDREEANRRHEAEMKRQDQQFQLQIEQMKAQQELQRLQMQNEANNNQKSVEMMLSFMQKTDADKESRANQQTQLQMEVMKQMGDMQRQSMEAQMAMLTSQLKEAKTKDDFFDLMKKMQTVQEFLNPSEPDKETWEKVTDKLGEAVPMLFTGLSALRAQPQPQFAPPPQYPQPGRMLPGSIAVVDDIDRVQGQVALRTEASAPPQAAPIRQAPVEPQAEENNAMTIKNDFTEFKDYDDSATDEQLLNDLLKNLDLAMQRSLAEDEMYDKFIASMPDKHRNFLKLLPADALIAYVEQNVPDDWELRSISAEVKLRALHGRLVSRA